MQIQHPAAGVGKQQRMAQVVGILHPFGRPEQASGSQLQADRPRSGFSDHSGSGKADRKSSLSVPAFQ